MTKARRPAVKKRAPAANVVTEQCYLYDAEETALIRADLNTVGDGGRLRIRIDKDGQPWTKVLMPKGSVSEADTTEHDRAHVCPPEPPENCAE